MRNIEEIFGIEDIAKRIEELKKKTVAVPKWSDLLKDYDPMQHKIFDPIEFPDKVLYDENGNSIGVEKITRVAIGLQKLAVKRMSEFMFTLSPKLTCEDADTDKLKEEQFAAIKKFLKKNKWKSLNKKRCRIISSQCEQATYWYLVKSKNSMYGFESEYKLKCAVFSPENGDDLYPLFDEMGDMIAFSREFEMRDGDKKVTYFETWTAKVHVRWKKGKDGGEGEEDAPLKELGLGKIPIIYSCRQSPIWADADNGKVHEMEKLLSQNGDIIEYHSAPVLLLKGALEGAPKKSEANKIFVAHEGGGAEYISWDQSPESVRFQFETLFRVWFTELQLPDLSFENIKGLGAASGEARKWLMADAHLKVGDESEIYEELFDREYSVIKAFMAIMNPKWKESINNLDIETEIVPFIISDEKTNVEVLIAANGGKPLISQERSVELAGFSEKPGDDWIKIQAEYEKEKSYDITEPTF